MTAGKYGAMKIKWLISTLAIVAILFTFGVIPASADQGELKQFHQPEMATARWVPDEIMVRFKGDREHFTVIKVRKGKVLEKVKEYSKRLDVDYAEPNYYVHALWEPNDPDYRYQWNLDNDGYGGIRMEEAWGIQTGSADVVVAVVDTGVAYENYSQGWQIYYLAPDLAETVFVPGYDFVENDTHPNDDNSHGTHVTGTIAQGTDNGVGVAGVAFNTAIMPVKVLDRNGSGTYTNVANGIIWATDHGANVINLSLGGSSPSRALEAAVQYAYDHGVTVVAAAGNDGSFQVSYPAAYDNYVIAVGATRYDETRAYYSNYGASLDLVAPGGAVNIDQNNDGYGDGVLQNTFNPNTRNTGDFGYWFFQGTSMAAPHVSGVAALLIAHGNVSTPDEVRTALQETAEDLGATGRDDTYGWGLVDAYAALGWTDGPVDNLPTVSITSPADGAMVSGVVTIDAYASDDLGVAQVDFYYGSTLIGTDETAPYSVAWDSTAVGDGVYTLTSTAIDTASQEASDSINVTVDNVNNPPVANAGPDQTVSDADGTGVETVILDGSGSYDPDGNISSYEWTKGGALLGTGEIISCDFAVGAHTITLTVTDDKGASASDDCIINVVANQAPAAPTAWVNIDLSKQFIRIYWVVTATVTITENNASGLAIAGAMVYGNWSGAHSGTVSGTADRGGKVSFKTIVRGSGIVTFTVTKIVKNGQEYILSGETSESISCSS
jgi:serine protease